MTAWVFDLSGYYVWLQVGFFRAWANLKLDIVWWLTLLTDSTFHVTIHTDALQCKALKHRLFYFRMPLALFGVFNWPDLEVVIDTKYLI